MPVVVPVKFPYASRDLWFDPEGLDIAEADYAICCTERGTEIGLVTADPFEVPAAELSAPLKSVIRIADDQDLDKADELAQRGEDAMRDFRRLVEQNGLDMKPVGVEFLFGGEKAVFYFAAEERVDFRQLVRDLSSCFHVRVDMRQIGVRDETRLAGGFATCGQELCCTRFGGQFEPVSIRMAKEQDLPLNSAKISGVCGRLMCCLRYEFEAYKDFKSRAPKKKALIDTPLGKARIQEYNTPREQLVLRLEGGKVFRVNLSDMTCSDECKKKAEQQGCACRPDCVTRDVLEKIESPEIKLALLEIDRQNGVDVGDGLDQSDRIATSGPTPGSRRRRSRGGDGEGAEAGKERRSRRKPKAAAGEDAAAGEGQGRRRRRRAGAAEGVPEQEERREQQAAPQEEGAGSQRRRRRHRSAGQKPDVPSVAEQVAEGEVKVTRRRRRPGDGGGAPAGASAPVPAAEAGAGAEQAGESQQPAKKRRRRRSRKPRKDAGEE